MLSKRTWSSLVTQLMFIVISESLLMIIGNTFTCFASMYLFWYLIRWMISPSEETYKAMPEWLRPTYVF